MPQQHTPNQPNKPVNLLRRQLTLAAWASPVVTAISLPSHAQTTPNPRTSANTSSCSAAGSWSAQGVAHQNGETANFSFTLNTDGTAVSEDTSLPPITWSESGGTVAIVMQDPDPANSDFATLSGAISPSCDVIAGGVLNANINGVDQEVGTWTAVRSS